MTFEEIVARCQHRLIAGISATDAFSDMQQEIEREKLEREAPCTSK